MKAILFHSTLLGALAALAAGAQAQDYSRSSLNPFSDASANPCKPIAIYPPDLDASQYLVKICAFPESDYQNIEFKNLRHTSPRSTTDPLTGETQLFPAETYLVHYQEGITKDATLYYTPCPDGVIMSYVYDSPSATGNYVSSMYVDRETPEPKHLPETLKLSPDIAQRHCPA